MTSRPRPRLFLDAARPANRPARACFVPLRQGRGRAMRMFAPAFGQGERQW